MLPKHVKPRLLGHFGTTPGLNFIYAHLNRVIKSTRPEHDVRDRTWTWRTWHCRQYLAGRHLHRVLSPYQPGRRRDAEALPAVFFPRRHPESVAPQTPGSIHEGGELGYSLVHALWSGVRQPRPHRRLRRRRRRGGDRSLGCGWHSNKFLDPVGDGAVLPILHLNGYKIANPTVLARIGDDELTSLLVGYGHRPLFVRGDEPADIHQQLAAALDDALGDITDIQSGRSKRQAGSRPAWPMIVLCTPKGWTCPKEVDGVPVESTFRAHQVPVADVRGNPGHLKILEDWMRSYRPEELFDESGRLSAGHAGPLADRDPADERQSPCQWGAAPARLEPSGFSSLWRHRRDAWRRIGRADAGAGEFPTGCHQREPITTSGSSVRMRRSRTDCRRFLRRRIGSGKPKPCRETR